jgi:hypothetical protein
MSHADTERRRTVARAVRLVEAARARCEASGHEHAQRVGRKVESVCIVDGCVEPGYPDGVYAFGDWNPVAFDAVTRAHRISGLPELLSSALERAGCEIHWEDEWTDCVECYRAVRTTIGGPGR